MGWRVMGGLVEDGGGGEVTKWVWCGGFGGEGDMGCRRGMLGWGVGKIFMMLDVKLCVCVWLLVYGSAPLFFPPHENSALCASRCFFDSGAELQV